MTVAIVLVFYISYIHDIVRIVFMQKDYVFPLRDIHHLNDVYTEVIPVFY